jgi:hypothetical protein
MNRIVVAAGIAIVIVGALLWWWPMPLSRSAAIPPNGQMIVGYGDSVSPGLSAETYTARWESSGSVNVTVSDCGSDASCSTPGAIVAKASAPSGSVAWTGAPGQYFLVAPDANGSVNVSVDTQWPLQAGWAGIALAGVGGIVIVAGALLPPTRRGPPPTPKPAP